MTGYADEYIYYLTECLH